MDLNHLSIFRIYPCRIFEGCGVWTNAVSPRFNPIQPLFLGVEIQLGSGGYHFYMRCLVCPFAVELLLLESTAVSLRQNPLFSRPRSFRSRSPPAGLVTWDRSDLAGKPKLEFQWDIYIRFVHGTILNGRRESYRESYQNPIELRFS